MRFGFYIICLALLSGFVAPAMGQNPTPFGSNRSNSDSYKPVPSLVVPHATLDPTTGDLLLLSNGWPNQPINLRRFHTDGTPDPKFILQRFESCCAPHPSLVAADSKGNIYVLEYRGDLGGFYLYKHAPSGKLDIDWGFGDKSTSSSSGSYGGSGKGTGSQVSKGSNKAETTLNWNAGGGRIQLRLRNPVDMVPRSDGSLLVLEQAIRTVYIVDPAGTSISQFIGSRDYIPINPFRLIDDRNGNLYMLDYYDQFDPVRKGKVGVFKFNPDGSFVKGWGEVSNGINAPYPPTIDFLTLVVDGQDNMIALGGDFAGANHGEVFTFDLAGGSQKSRKSVDYMMGPDTGFLGMVGGLQSGFVLLEARDFTVLVNYYDTNGKRNSQIQIKNLYQAE